MIPMHAVSGMTIKGEMSASEDITFDGTFEGSIDLPQHRFVAGKNARVNASIKAKTVSVDGHLDGHIAADVVDISPTAVVSGSIVSPKLSVNDGANVNASVNTERARAAGSVAKHRATGK
jgi:cytoskeletal protein CcmA (bactofilin family)